MRGAFFKNTVAVGGITLLSRVSGFVRDFCVARWLGAGRFSDCFLIAFKIPNLFRAVFAEGAFNSAFVPLFSGIRHDGGEAAAREFSRSIFAVLFYALLVFTLLAEIFMPSVVSVFAPGFDGEPGKFALAVSLSRITFPFLMFVALASFFGSILNSLGLFRPYALAPIVLNVMMVGSLVLFGSRAPEAARALSWAVSSAGLAQLAWLAWLARRRGFGVMSLRFRMSAEVVRFFRRILPGVLGAGIYHVNVLVGSIFATATDGAVSWIYYADRIGQLPVGVIGVALATVMLPDLSGEVGRGRHRRGSKLLNDSMMFASLLVIPCAAGLMALAYPLVQVFFERGAFGPPDTAETARVLAVLCVSLPALVYSKLLSNAFYARHDTGTPMGVAALTLAVNVALILVLTRSGGYMGVVVSIAASNWVGVAVLAALGIRAGCVRIYRRLAANVAKIALVSAAMGVLVRFGAAGMVADTGAYSFLERFLMLAALVAAGAALYVPALFALGVIRPSDIRNFRRGR